MVGLRVRLEDALNMATHIPLDTKIYRDGCLLFSIGQRHRSVFWFILRHKSHSIMLAHDALRVRQKSHSIGMISLQGVVISMVALESRLTDLGLGALLSGSDDVP